MGIAAGDQALRVVPLDAPGGRVGPAPLRADIGETAVADRHADIAGESMFGAVALIGLAPLGFRHAAVGPVLEDEIDDAGDGVGAILRRGRVAQHLDALERDRRDHADVGTLCAVRNAVTEKGDDRRAVAPLAVDEHQSLVGAEAAQIGGADERRLVADRLRVDVVRRNQRAHDVRQVGRALIRKIFAADEIDRRRGIGGRTHGPAGSHDINVFKHIFRIRLIALGEQLGRADKRCRGDEGREQHGAQTRRTRHDMLHSGDSHREPK